MYLRRGDRNRAIYFICLEMFAYKCFIVIVLKVCSNDRGNQKTNGS